MGLLSNAKAGVRDAFTIKNAVTTLVTAAGPVVAGTLLGGFLQSPRITLAGIALSLLYLSTAGVIAVRSRPSDGNTRPVLDLDTSFPMIYRTRSGLFEPIGSDGWVIAIPGARLTNRSDRNVSLGVTLTVALRNSPKGPSWKLTSEDAKNSLLERTAWAHNDMLRFPLDISPHSTKAGTICFLIMPQEEHWLGGSETIDHNNASLAIQDYVSGQSISVQVSNVDWGDS